MDAERFDELARTRVSATSRTSRTSRRGALAGVASGLAAALPVARAADAAKKKKPCPPCKKRKKGKCRATLPDGTACAGGSCQGGSCIAAAPATGGCASGQKPCDGSCIASNQCCDNGDCQVSGQVCTARQCTCPAIFPDVCGGACVSACDPITELREPSSPTCRCCIRNLDPDEGSPNNCCSGRSSSGQCRGRPAGDGCSWDAVCNRLNCVEGECSDCVAGESYCVNGVVSNCNNGAGRCLNAIDGTTRCGIPEVGNEGDCGWCTRNFDCDQGVRPGRFCAVADGPNCGCPQGQTFCAAPV